jgi:ribosomal protein S18 acetylase RimI-like enzyme
VPEVRPATDAEFAAIGELYAAAFADDPIFSWLSPERATWERRAPGWFAAHVRYQARHGAEVLVDDDLRGAAIWLPPGAWRTSGIGEALALGLPSIRLFKRRLRTASRVVARMEGMHPKAPHWYLSTLATHPDHQGRGVGRALISPIGERCDAEGVPAYLETAKAENVSYYLRHGFRVQDEIRVSSGPPMWLMWRTPQA